MAIGVVLSVVLLLPNTLEVPHAHTTLITTQRVALIGLAANLLLRIRRGELPTSVLRRTPVHDTFFVFLVVSFVLGVILAQPDISVTDTSHGWSVYVDYFLFFAVMVAAIRALPDECQVLWVLAGLLGVSVVIGALEHFTRHGWAHVFFRGTDQIFTVPAHTLEGRAGDVRVRVASDFSLAFAWLAASLLPIALAIPFLPRREVGTSTTRHSRLVPLQRRLRAAQVQFRRIPVDLVAWAMAAATVGILYWTHTRSIAASLILVLVTFAVTAGKRVFQLYALAAIGLVGLAYFASTTVAHGYSSNLDQHSINVRLERIPAITEALVNHSVHGLGFSGLASIGFPGVDSSFLLMYGEIGVVGLTLFAIVYGVVIVCVLRGVTIPDPRRRTITIAITLGLLTLMGAGFFFDAVHIDQNARLLFILAAVGVVVAERSVGPPRWLALPTPTRLLALASAVGGGLLLYYAAPTHVSTTYDFATVQPYTQVQSVDLHSSDDLANSVCEVLAIADFTRAPVVLTCRNLGEGTGFGEVRAEAPDEHTATLALFEAFQVVRSAPRLSQVRPYEVEGFTTGRPTALRTAPIWLPMLVGAGVILIPPERERRHRHVRRRFRRARAG